MAALITVQEMRELVSAPDYTDLAIQNMINAADSFIVHKAGKHYETDETSNEPIPITQVRLNPGHLFSLQRNAQELKAVRHTKTFPGITDNANSVPLENFFLNNGNHVLYSKGRMSDLWAVDYVPENDNDLRKWITTQIVNAMINSEPGIASTDIDRRRAGYAIFHYASIASESQIAIASHIRMLMKTELVG